MKDPQTQPIICAQCKASSPEGLYDDRAGQYYCDTQCFEDWADDSHEVVTLFYADMNVK